MEHILSLSYGKDSMACFGACELLGWPIDRVVTAEVWATDTIPADLPPMVEFKKHADKIIKERWGIEVEHVRSQWTYEKHFYQPHKYGNTKVSNPDKDGIYGFPVRVGPWCNPRLKVSALPRGCNGDIVYLGIALDEPSRFHNLTETKKSPLVEAGWNESYCRKWCEENELLSPIYTTAARGGCWFCHNQGVNQLRLLRRDYPELWALLLKWDLDSPVAFKSDGHTVHDFDRRFYMEDIHAINPDEPFRWAMLDQVSLFEGSK